MSLRNPDLQQQKKRIHYTSFTRTFKLHIKRK